MEKFLAVLMIASGLIAADNSSPTNPEEVACRGQIESFVKDGFEAIAVEGGGSETFDITWVRLRAPAEFTGVHHMLLSKSPDGKSPFGAVGDNISFSAFRSTLDAEKQPERSRVAPKDLVGDPKENAK